MSDFALAVLSILLVLLMLIHLVVAHRAAHRQMDNTRSIEDERLLRHLELFAEAAALPSTKEDDRAA